MKANSMRFIQHTLMAVVMSLMMPAMAHAQAVNKDVDIMYYFGCHDGNYITADGGLLNQKMENTLSDYDSRRWNGHFRLGLQHYFKKHFGLGVGVGYNLIRLDSIPAGGYVQRIAGAIDERGRSYEHQTVFHDFSESAKLHALDFDFKAYYQANISISWKFYAAGGFMMSLYPKAKYDTEGYIETRAYYDEYKLNVGSVQGHHIYTDSGFDGQYSLKPSLSITAEAGLLYAICPRVDAYLSCIGFWRLTPLPASSSSLLYNPDCMSADAYQDIKYSGMLDCGESPKIGSLSLGVQLGVRFRISKNKEMEFEEFRHARRVREIEDFDFKRVRRIDFDQVQHRRREIADSIAMEQEARRLREIKELEMERQQRAKDSLEAIAADSIARAQALADSLSIEIDPENAMPENRDLQDLNMILQSINQNYCMINSSRLANIQELNSTIDRLAKILASNEEIRVIVKGHTCNLGSEQANKSLGMRRAQGLRDILIGKGARPSQIKCESVWWKEPLMPNTSESNRSKNRRVEVKMEK